MSPLGRPLLFVSLVMHVQSPRSHHTMVKPGHQETTTPSFRNLRATLVDDRGSERTDSMSDTVSCAQLERTRRLLLVWNTEMPATGAVPQDNHDQRLNRVSQAMQHERRCVQV